MKFIVLFIQTAALSGGSPDLKEMVDAKSRGLLKRLRNGTLKESTQERMIAALRDAKFQGSKPLAEKNGEHTKVLLKTADGGQITLEIRRDGASFLVTRLVLPRP